MGEAYHVSRTFHWKSNINTLTRNTSNNIQQPLLTNPLRSPTNTRQQRTRQLPLLLGNILTRIKPTSTLPNKRRSIRHSPDNRRRLPARTKPLPQLLQLNTRRNTNNQRRPRLLAPTGAQFAADVFRHLRFDGEDGDVGFGGELGVGSADAKAHGGEFVAVDVPGLRDGDVFLFDVAGEKAADDGCGHVAAADEGDFGVLERGSHCELN